MKLLEYLAIKDLSQSDFAKKLSISLTHFNMVVHGKRTPSIYLARRIEEMTNGDVPVYELLDVKIPILEEKKKDCEKT